MDEIRAALRDQRSTEERERAGRSWEGALERMEISPDLDSLVRKCTRYTDGLQW